MKNVYLSFCGYKIKVLFKNEIKSLDLINSINLNYLDAIVKPFKKQDLTIIVKDIKGPQILLKDNSVFIKLFFKKSKKIFADYTLGIYGLEYIFFYFLENKTQFSDSIILHSSSVIDVNKKCHIFLGRQGIGKSTIVTKLSKKGFIPFTDDNVFIRGKGKKFLCYQMPFVNSEKNTSKKYFGYQLESVNFLKRSTSKFELKKANKKEVIALISKSKKKFFPDLNINNQNIYNFTIKFKNFRKLFSSIKSDIDLQPLH